MLVAHGVLTELFIRSLHGPRFQARDGDFARRAGEAARLAFPFALLAFAVATRLAVAAAATLFCGFCSSCSRMSRTHRLLPAASDIIKTTRDVSTSHQLSKTATS